MTGTREAPKAPNQAECPVCGRTVETIEAGCLAIHWRSEPGRLCPGTGRAAERFTSPGRDEAVLHDPRRGGPYVVTVYPDPDWATGVPR